ncbi:hypothetical protein Tcan_10146 [Toxocara canis]|uniref:Uncharacterized protein n=1 Tax=Toxocara canis TaxID=6265 RepID=A0A0B2V828_TOXCA|nr:hypothetical protein Tcan_10146 [Toxocara canis]
MNFSSSQQYGIILEELANLLDDRENIVKRDHANLWRNIRMEMPPQGSIDNGVSAFEYSLEFHVLVVFYINFIQNNERLVQLVEMELCTSHTDGASVPSECKIVSCPRYKNGTADIGRQKRVQ